MCKYTNWYFGNFATQGFRNSEHFAEVVGPRPDANYSLTRMGGKKGEPLTPDNFVWVTQEALRLAKEGKLRFPKLSDQHTPLQQRVNDSRFGQHVKGILHFAERHVQRDLQRQQWEMDLQVILSKMEDFVVSRGYQATQAMDPTVLPDHPKLNQGRALANKLMRYLSGDYYKIQSLERLNKRNKEKARLEREQKIIENSNRLYTGKRGRPMEKFVKKRVRISALTPEQRQVHGIPAGQDYLIVKNPTGRNVRVWTVMVDVPNPKLQSVAA